MRKGFTLIELIITIALIGILTTIIVSSYRKIADQNLQKVYDGKVKEIEAVALKYVNDNLDEFAIEEENGYIDFNFEDLITEGYLAGDNDDETKLTDPRDNSIMEGYIRVYYEGKVVNVKYYEQ